MAPKKSKPKSGNTQADVPFPLLDFKASDDAWYGVRLVLYNNTLVVKYLDFPEEFDDWFNAWDFKSLEEVESFKGRFRPTSLQLQDHECTKVIEEMCVCASHPYGDNEMRFYDAVIEEKISKAHNYSKGEEECLCTFVVLWLHGPNSGQKKSIGIEDICLIPNGDTLHPTLDSFVKISKEKLEEGAHSEVHFSTIKSKSSRSGGKPPYNYSQEAGNSKLSGCETQTFKGRISNYQERIIEDMDLGGKSSLTNDIAKTNGYYSILIENLEKDLLSSTVVDFIYRQTSILAQAFIFPSLSSELYTRGIIIVDNQEKLGKIYDFLCDPAQMVMSSRGRPWIVTEGRHGNSRSTFGASMPKTESFRCTGCEVGVRRALSIADPNSMPTHNTCSTPGKHKYQSNKFFFGLAF
ncbi:PREDICTED: uncharacterized protein LOC104587893 isoform X2 [Nelumbo nucifera]|uniref:Uncharacterized protein LOC104587893 isoform X2 n=1 Tax=Nelumbo nucifera TaxID=4432 RepID=A0A1U7Z0C7_NELNU|nr:PREDICTED: uncharacterized protein LOC104587893 isoform X2 [Nelumbo nucifera]